MADSDRVAAMNLDSMTFDGGVFQYDLQSLGIKADGRVHT